VSAAPGPSDQGVRICSVAEFSEASPQLQTTPHRECTPTRSRLATAADPHPAPDKVDVPDPDVGNLRGSGGRFSQCPHHGQPRAYEVLERGTATSRDLLIGEGPQRAIGAARQFDVLRWVEDRELEVASHPKEQPHAPTPQSHRRDAGTSAVPSVRSRDERGHLIARDLAEGHDPVTRRDELGEPIDQSARPHVRLRGKQPATVWGVKT